MPTDQDPKAVPQFETAEFKTQPGAAICAVCRQAISGAYFRVNGKMVCGACTDRLKNSGPQDSHAAFMRALLFGGGGAIAGLALYATVTIVTGLMIGYVSLAVGWIVGKAMMKGSGGLGGRRYQIAAILFTYAAVSVAAIPIAISEFSKQKKSQSEHQVQSPAATNDASSPNDADSSGQASPSNSESGTRPGSRSFGTAIGYLVILGLGSPFLELGSDPFHGLIGLVILLVGVRIAWQITRGRPPLVFDGPF